MCTDSRDEGEEVIGVARDFVFPLVSSSNGDDDDGWFWVRSGGDVAYRRRPERERVKTESSIRDFHTELSGFS